VATTCCSCFSPPLRLDFFLYLKAFLDGRLFFTEQIKFPPSFGLLFSRSFFLFFSSSGPCTPPQPPFRVRSAFSFSSPALVANNRAEDRPYVFFGTFSFPLPFPFFFEVLKPGAVVDDRAGCPFFFVSSAARFCRAAAFFISGWCCVGTPACLFLRLPLRRSWFPQWP